MAAKVETTCRSPRPCGGIVEFGAVAVFIDTHDQDLAVLQQRRSVAIAGGVEIAGCSPKCGRRVVQLRAVKSEATLWRWTATESARNQDLAVWQQGRRLAIAIRVEISGATPHSRSRII